MQEDIYDLYNAKIVVKSAFQVLKTKPFLNKSSQQDPELYKRCLNQQSSNISQTTVRVGDETNLRPVP